LSLFTVDRDKCRRDGICAAVCPMSIIKAKGGDGFPAPAAGAEELCINCGHCVAACPHGAMSLAAMDSAGCRPVSRDLLPGPGQVEHLLQARRSIRCYQERPVERAVLTGLIDTARYAPSGHNLQPVHWLVVGDAAEVRRLAGLVIEWMCLMIEERPAVAQAWHFDRLVAAWEGGRDLICRHAPHLVAVHAAKTERTAPPACTIALTYLDLAAFSRGLGACWAGYFGLAATAHPPLIEALALPEGHQVFGAMLIGYPRFAYHRIPARKEPTITWR